MAAKVTYMYQVTMGYGSNDKEVAYCYARNAGNAVDGMKTIFKEKKYDSFKAKLFGEADFQQHPEPFMPMSREEVGIIENRKLADAPLYAMRKDNIPAGGEFIPVSKEGDIL